MMEDESKASWGTGLALAAAAAAVGVLVVALVGLGGLSVETPGAKTTGRVERSSGKASQMESAIPRDADEGESARPEVVAALQPDEDPLTASIRKELDFPEAVPNEALLTFKSKAELALFLRQAGAFGLKLLGTIDGLNAVRVGYDNLRQLRDYLAAAGTTAPSFEANQWMNVPRLPRPAEGNQGGAAEVGESFLAQINALDDRTDWGSGLTVAVLDTGVKDHPTFGPGQVSHVDLVNDGKPLHSHGTSVASLVAGQDERVPGVAPAAKILDIRVADTKGYSVTSVMAQGIFEAVNRGANVINISMGGYRDSAMLRQAIGFAMQKGVFVVAAAGNEGYDGLAYPAAIPEVISVGSVDGQKRQAYFSNSGQGLDFAAPGVGLNTAWETNMVALASGTSQSAGVVSGIIVANLSLGVRAPDLLRQMQLDAKATGAPPNQVGKGIAQVTRRKK